MSFAWKIVLRGQPTVIDIWYAKAEVTRVWRSVVEGRLEHIS